MRLAFWNNGDPIEICDTRFIMLPSGNTLIGLSSAMPVIDIYNLIDQRTTPDAWHKTATSWYEKEGENILIKNTVEPLMTVNAARSVLIQNARRAAYNLLLETDWMIVRSIDDESSPVPNSVKTYRQAVRDACSAYETSLQSITDYEVLVQTVLTWPESE